MTVHISGGAAREIIQETAKHIDRVGAEYIPVVVWIIHDTEIGSITPRLGLGLIERDLVAVDRFLECDEFECEIAQHLPDDVLA